MNDSYRAQIMVCAGAACISSGCRDLRDAIILKVKEYGLEKEVMVVETGCVGACDLGPLALVNPEGIFYQKLAPEDADEIVKEHLLKGNVVERLLYRDPSRDTVIPRLRDIPFFKNQVKIVLRNCGIIDPMDIEDYVAHDGYEALRKVLTSMSGEDVIREVTDSGLRGRGGGGFPTGMKWQFTHKAEGKVKYVVCNADEGDPGAFMDRSVLEGDPHSVIEAMSIAGYAIGGQQGYVYVRAEYPLAIERLEKAITQAREKGFLGKDIFGAGFDFDIDIRIGAGAFVCGEETALLMSIEGKRGEPRPRPPFPAVKGLFGCPTLLNNVETYANIPAIIMKGAGWYRDFGTEKSRGTKVFALAGNINNTGLVEVPMGTSLGELIFNVGGGIKNGRRFKAAQLGGPSGGCIPTEHLNVSIDYESVAELGAIVGSGGLIVTDEDTCMVDFARFFIDFIQDESCGKCPPCRIGTKRMLEILTRITEGKGEEEDIDRLIELGTRIKDAALCGLGQTAPNPVLSTLRYFRDEYIEHIRDKHCRAGVCASLFDAPCQNTCPADQNAWGYVALIAEGRFREAIEVIKEGNPFPGVCGRICVHTCEHKCRRGQIDQPVAICGLKRFAADVDMASPEPYRPTAAPPLGIKVAVIGAGPAGLSAAYFLTIMGYTVTIFEATPVAGGMLALGVPEYRLPREVLNSEIKAITDMGVEIRYNTTMGIHLTMNQLFDHGYRAVLLATGAHTPIKMGIDGEDTEGVVSGVHLLRHLAFNRPIKTHRQVVVVGGGNVAIDAARSIMRMGAESVTLLYRRDRADMPADMDEITEAEREGIRILDYTVPRRVISEEGRVSGVECAGTALGPFDESGRRSPQEVPGTEFNLAADMVITAVGQRPNMPYLQNSQINVTRQGTVEVNGDLSTARPGIFAAGDNVRGPATLVEAIADARRSALSIDRYLGGKGERKSAFRDGLVKLAPGYNDEPYRTARERAIQPHLPLDRRMTSFTEVVGAYDDKTAMEEARRCLRCYLKEQ